MFYQYDPDAWIAVVETRTCRFHGIAPGEPYPGCTCIAAYSNRRATPEEYARNREARLEREARVQEAYRAVGYF